jgi:PAS domain S-box-containing protein
MKPQINQTSSLKILFLCLCLAVAGFSVSIIPAYLLTQKAQQKAYTSLAQWNQSIGNHLSSKFQQLTQDLKQSVVFIKFSKEIPSPTLLQSISSIFPKYTTLKWLSSDQIHPDIKNQLIKAAKSSQTLASTVTFNDNGTAIVELLQPVISNTHRLDGALKLSVKIPDMLNTNKLPKGFDFSIFDLKQQAKQPFFHLLTSFPPDNGEQKARSTLVVGDREWLVESPMTNTFALSYASKLAGWVWLPGCLLTLLLCLRVWHSQQNQERYENRLSKLNELLDRNQRTMENKHIEKEVLTQALMDSEKRTRDFLLLANDYFWELDTDFNYVFTSPQTAKIKGIAPQDLMNKSLFEFVADDSHDALKQQMKATVKTGNAISLNLKIRDADQRIYTEIIRLVPLIDGLGAHIGYRGTGQRQDI